MENVRTSDLCKVDQWVFEIGRTLDMTGRFQISTYGRFWKVVHPTLETQTPSPPQSCCCGPALAPSRWTAIWPTERGARLPASHLLSKQNQSQTLKLHCIEAKGKETTFKRTFKKLTSLFWHGSSLRDVGERVKSFGREALALFVLQRCYIWQLQRTENKKCLSKTRIKKPTNKRWSPGIKKKKKTDLDFSAWFSLFMVSCFLVLGLRRKFDGSSFTFPVVTVLPFFFTGS